MSAPARCFSIEGLFLLAASWLILPAASAAAQSPSGTSLTVMYSSSLNGNLDGCGCKGRPRAGLVKRAAWLRDFGGRSEALLVDAGDILDVEEDPDLSAAILSSYRELGYDAVAVGEQELSDGIEALGAYGERYPLVAHNLRLCFEDRCLYFSPQPTLLLKGAQRVGLLALLDPEVLRLHPKELTSRIKLEPPLSSAEALVGSLKERGIPWIVVLYHGTVQQAEQLARRLRGIDLIVVGHEHRLVEPRRIGQTLIVSPGEEGNRIGILKLSRDARGRLRFDHELRLFSYERDPDDPRIRELIEEYRAKLRRAMGSE